MDDLISRQAAIETVKKHYRGIDNDLLEIIAYEMEKLPPTQPSATNTNVGGNLIDRQAVLDAMETWDKFGCDPDGKLVRYDDDKHYIPYVHYEDMVHAIKHLPSAQPQRMRGEWIDVTKTGGAELWKCSECGELELEDSYFCPNCGADMRKDGDHHEG